MPGIQSPEEGMEFPIMRLERVGRCHRVLDIKPGPCGRAVSTLE